MRNSFWVKPPHIPVTIPERLLGRFVHRTPSRRC